MIRFLQKKVSLVVVFDLALAGFLQCFPGQWRIPASKDFD
jgi:hypothetical protein